MVWKLLSAISIVIENIQEFSLSSPWRWCWSTFVSSPSEMSRCTENNITDSVSNPMMIFPKVIREWHRCMYWWMHGKLPPFVLPLHCILPNLPNTRITPMLFTCTSGSSPSYKKHIHLHSWSGGRDDCAECIHSRAYSTAWKICHIYHFTKIKIIGIYPHYPHMNPNLWICKLHIDPKRYPKQLISRAAINKFPH